MSTYMTQDLFKEQTKPNSYRVVFEHVISVIILKGKWTQYYLMTYYTN